VCREAHLPDAPGLAAELLAATRDLPAATAAPLQAVGVVLNVHPERGNYLLGPTTHVLSGRDHIVDHADGLDFRVSFPSFLQVHRDAATILYRPALAMLGDLRGATVVDGYGGVGTFGLRVARAAAQRVTIVEANPSACADARANVVRNGLEGVTVVESPFATAAGLPTTPDALIVDPPRAGLGDAGCRRVLALAAARVLYVSCNPVSLARDLQQLAATYVVTAARLVDLFPHTAHVEVLVRLERRRP
jgi:23S rRNA (uracil1939-C5)-methyltransferase